MGEIGDRKRTRSPRAITIDLDLCKACGICADLCPSSVFDRDGRGHPVVARLCDCTACLFCERHCPDFAIAIERRPAPRPDDRSAIAGDETPIPAAGVAATSSGRPQSGRKAPRR